MMNIFVLLKYEIDIKIRFTEVNGLEDNKRFP